MMKTLARELIFYWTPSARLKIVLKAKEEAVLDNRA